MLSNRRHNLILGWAVDGGRRGRESEQVRTKGESRSEGRNRERRG